MKTFLAILFLLPSLAFGRGLTLRDPAFAGSLRKVTATSNDPVFNTLTHYYLLGESSGNSRTDSKGTLTLNETSGNLGSAPAKRGDGVSSVDDGSNLLSASTTINYPFSIAIWINLAALSSVDIFGSRNGQGFYLGYNFDPSQIFYFSSNADNGSSHVLSLTTDSFHLIVCTSDGTTDKISVDGGTFVTGTIAGVHDANEPIVISANNSFNGAGAVGLLDEAMIFSSALTQGNVTTLYNSGAGTFYTP